MNPCQPLFVHCRETVRVAMCHWDGRGLVSLHKVMRWVNAGSAGTIYISIQNLQPEEDWFRPMKRLEGHWPPLPGNHVIRHVGNGTEQECGMACDGTFLDSHSIYYREDKDNPARYSVFPEGGAWWDACTERLKRYNTDFVAYQTPIGYIAPGPASVTDQVWARGDTPSLSHGITRPRTARDRRDLASSPTPT